MTPQEFTKTQQDAITLLGAIKNVISFQLIGSGLYLPANKISDVDFAVLIPHHDSPEQFGNALGPKAGFFRCSTYDADIGEDTHWTAVRRDHLNLMVTNNRAWYDRYLLAMNVCAFLKLEAKRDRIGVCRIVRDGKSIEEVKEWLAANTSVHATTEDDEL